MNWKHVFWIVPLSLIFGLLIGFTSRVYIAVPEMVTIEMGYDKETLEVLNNCYNLSLPSEPSRVNVTLKEAEQAVMEVIPYE